MFPMWSLYNASSHVLRHIVALYSFVKIAWYFDSAAIVLIVDTFMMLVNPLISRPVLPSINLFLLSGKRL